MFATQTKDYVSLKLLVNKETKKVIFAEAGKDFVDVLFSFSTLPLGTIARLVQNDSDFWLVRVGCLNSLHNSVTNLDKDCLSTDTCKEMLLRPRNSSEDYCRSMKLNIDDTWPTTYHLCSKLATSTCSHRLFTFPYQRCECGSNLTRSVSFKSKKTYEGFVNDGATFIVTDDLIVMPNTTDTSFGVFHKCGIQNPTSVQTMTATVTKKMVLDLLKCCLFSKSTMTDFFLVNKPILNSSSFSPCGVRKSSTIQIKVKIVMRKCDGKILFVQGEEDFADFLLSFRTFPLGAVIRMLEGYSCLGSVDALYKSIVDLNHSKYFKYIENVK